MRVMQLTHEGRICPSVEQARQVGQAIIGNAPNVKECTSPAMVLARKSSQSCATQKRHQRPQQNSCSHKPPTHHVCDRHGVCGSAGAAAVDVWRDVVNLLAVLVCNGGPTGGAGVCAKNDAILQTYDGVKMRYNVDKRGPMPIDVLPCCFICPLFAPYK